MPSSCVIELNLGNPSHSLTSSGSRQTHPMQNRRSTPIRCIANASLCKDPPSNASSPDGGSAERISIVLSTVLIGGGEANGSPSGKSSSSIN